MKNLLSLMFLMFILALAAPLAMAGAPAEPMKDTFALVIVAVVFVGVTAFVIWRKRKSRSGSVSGGSGGGAGGGPRPPTQQH